MKANWMCIYLSSLLYNSFIVCQLPDENQKFISSPIHIEKSNPYTNIPSEEVYPTDTIHLNLLLVEFRDVKHRSPSYLNNLEYKAYTLDDFNNLIYSERIYFSPRSYSPDRKKVYGSLNDYYQKMSNNKLVVTGKVLNKDTNKDNIPDWLTLSNTKKYYDNGRINEFRIEAKSIAKENNININVDQKHFLAIVYAGHTYRSFNNKSLNPHAFYKDHEYITGERFAADKPYRQERDNPKENRMAHFAHIGIHAHEFGHLLGFEDHIGGLNNEYWCLMSKGCFNGPNGECACPAPLNPYLRWMQGWINIEEISYNCQKKLTYNLADPVIYKIIDNQFDSFFLLEARNFKSYNILCEMECPDYNSFVNDLTSGNGVLVWRKIAGDYVKLLYSCGYDCSEGDNHIFPGKSNVNVISPWSDNRLCEPGTYWVPNTKPSMNCGFEIISKINDYFIIDLYAEDPWLSSPSNPKNLELLPDSIVMLSWDKSCEPDFHYYNIYKKIDSRFKLYNSCYKNEFVDSLEKRDTTYTSSRILAYKLTAVDSYNNESTFSNIIEVKSVNILNSLNSKVTDEDYLPILYNNYPNPFNSSTTIKYSIPLIERRKMKNGFISSLPDRQTGGVRGWKVILKVYDVLGRELKTLINDKQMTGNYEVEFNGGGLTSGIYIYRLQIRTSEIGSYPTDGKAREYFISKKMLMIK